MVKNNVRADKFDYFKHGIHSYSWNLSCFQIAKKKKVINL